MVANNALGNSMGQQLPQPPEQGPCSPQQAAQQGEHALPEKPCPGQAVLPATGAPSAEFCINIESAMHKATWGGVQATKDALPAQMLQAIVLGVTPILNQEPTMVKVQPGTQQQRVTVVGDTHGQYHDLCRLFKVYGHPDADRIYIFNGDYVDRGAWGVETLTLLLAWKWALPNNVYLLRGNHETNMITRIYGFYAELKAKYGAAAKGLFTHIRRMFAHLPLAALVEGNTLILHGGLFRAPPKKGKGSKRRRPGGALTLGTLDDLRKASKGGQDPDPDRSVKNTIASDVLWSDPVNTPGLMPNEARGCGTVYGPDATESFLSANGLKLIIRSHEGPDARDKRIEDNKMPSIDTGYALDHETKSGRLVTLFSAPDYPQFMAEGEQRYNNRAAVLHLTAPDYATPAVESFEADLPRPQAESYYDVPGFSDDEEELEQYSDEQQTTAAGITRTGATLQQHAETVDQSVATSAPSVTTCTAEQNAQGQVETASTAATATEAATRVSTGCLAEPTASAAKQQSSQMHPSHQQLQVYQQSVSGAMQKGVPAPLSPLQQQELSASVLGTYCAAAAAAGVAAQHEVMLEGEAAGEGCCECDGTEPASKRRKAAGHGDVNSPMGATR